MTSNGIGEDLQRIIHWGGAPYARPCTGAHWEQGEGWELGLGKTFSTFFSKFAGVGRKEKFRRNLQAPGKKSARPGTGIRTAVWDCTVDLCLCGIRALQLHM